MLQGTASGPTPRGHGSRRIRMQMTRRAGRRAAVVPVVLGAAMVLAACGDGGGEETSAASCTNTIMVEDAPVVTVWAWYPAMEQVVDYFNENNDDVQACWTNAGQGGDAYQAFSTALEAGSGAPDVMMIEAEFLGQYTIRVLAVDLAPYGAAELEGEYTEGAWADVTEAEAVYAIPVDGGPMGLLYRQDIFDEYGVAVPTTWEEFATAAQQLKDAGYDGYITNFAPNWWAFVQAMAAQLGWQPFTYDSASTEIVIHIATPEAIQVLSYWEDLVDRDLVGGDEVAVHEVLPVRQDLDGLGGGDVDDDLGARRVVGEGLPAQLRRHRLDERPPVRREVRDVPVVPGVLQLLRRGRELLPRGRHGDAVLVEDVLAVEQAHGSAVDGDGVHGLCLGHVRPGALRVLALELGGTVRGEVDEGLADRVLPEELRLDHHDVGGPGAGLQRRAEGLVRVPALTGVGPARLDVVVVLVEVIDDLLHGGVPGPDGDDRDVLDHDRVGA